MNNDNWDIGVCSWVIEDGTYDDFACGKTEEIALEFYPDIVYLSGIRNKLAEKCGRSKYKVNAEVIYLSEDVWVVDFGIRAYLNEKPPEFVTLNNFYAMEIKLEAEMCTYFEFALDRPQMPQIHYSWMIDAIHIEVLKSGSLMALQKTSVGREEDKIGRHYILSCTKLALLEKDQITNGKGVWDD